MSVTYMVWNFYKNIFSQIFLPNHRYLEINLTILKNSSANYYDYLHGPSSYMFRMFTKSFRLFLWPRWLKFWPPSVCKLCIHKLLSISLFLMGATWTFQRNRYFRIVSYILSQCLRSNTVTSLKVFSPADTKYLMKEVLINAPKPLQFIGIYSACITWMQ